MKKFVIALVVALLSACSGSDTYRGKWKALDAGGHKYEIDFSADSFSIREDSGQASVFKYSQHSWESINSVETYGIQISDGRNYQIYFPTANDQTKGIIRDGSGVPVYTIGRNGYVQYDELSKLK